MRAMHVQLQTRAINVLRTTGVKIVVDSLSVDASLCVFLWELTHVVLQRVSESRAPTECQESQITGQCV